MSMAEDSSQSQCLPGFAGSRCQTDINECASNPCKHGGTCTDSINGFVCACGSAFSGFDCNNDFCPPQTCQNGGTCASLATTFQCTCATGFNGTNCESNIDDCASAPCLNAGTCNDGVNSFTCSCGLAFSGPRCEIHDTTAPNITCPDQVFLVANSDNINFTPLNCAYVMNGVGERDSACTVSSSDNIGTVSITALGSKFLPLGTTTVVFQATDRATLVAQCSVNVTVQDLNARLELQQQKLSSFNEVANPNSAQVQEVADFLAVTASSLPASDSSAIQSVAEAIVTVSNAGGNDTLNANSRKAITSTAESLANSLLDNAASVISGDSVVCGDKHCNTAALESSFNCPADCNRPRISSPLAAGDTVFDDFVVPQWDSSFKPISVTVSLVGVLPEPANFSMTALRITDVGSSYDDLVSGGKVWGGGFFLVVLCCIVW